MLSLTMVAGLRLLQRRICEVPIQRGQFVYFVGRNSYREDWQFGKYGIDHCFGEESMALYPRMLGVLEANAWPGRRGHRRS